ncbi:hypothetical protein CAAN1_22S00980 [[Candida] anglica]|uniref:U6 small nuclear RNA (adenine-(43)-N(6))-methyltransferase n=1 Tax=[Candida] anglica TaxID=148631 RepID=A0ABP0ENG9_9ASCO
MEIDFVALRTKYPVLAKNFIGNHYNFDKPGAVYDLSEVILKDVYGLTIELDRLKLCPRIPNRRSYLEWCEKRFKAQLEVQSERDPTSTATLPVYNIDIGTGSSAIYALLGVKLAPKSRFIGTEIDSNSIKHAQIQIDRNNLNESITLVEIDNPNEIIPDSLLQAIPQNSQVGYTMCNPPFYSTWEELESRNKIKPERANKLHGSESELYHEDGGEYGFIKKYIAQSLDIKHPGFKNTWFTCQLGLEETGIKLKRHLESLSQRGQIEDYIIHELEHPGITRRNVVAWATNNLYRWSFKSISIMNDLELVYDKLVTFKFVKSWKSKCNSNVYIESEFPVWTRKFSRMVRFQSDKISKLKPQPMIVRISSDEIVWIYGNDKYSWETFITWIERFRKRPRPEI